MTVLPHKPGDIFASAGSEYVLGAPQLPKIVMHLAGGRTFTVRAEGISKERKYVKSAMLNGKKLSGFKIRHEDILNGGELVFEMVDTP